MDTQVELTEEYYLDRIERVFAARDKGDIEEAHRIQREAPLSIENFKVVKALLGKNYIQQLQDEGFDFSLVEATYGKNYIN